MTDERSPESMLRGRLADIYVPALVSGTVDALSRRLGNRATVDDPVHGRASSLASVEPLLARAASLLAHVGARYEHVSSTTGVDRDASEGRLIGTRGGSTFTLPIAVVAERRRLREIELRVYCAEGVLSAAGEARATLAAAEREDAELRGGLAVAVAAVLNALRDRAVDRALTSFEEASRAVDATGVPHSKQGGALRAYLSSASFDLELAGIADDGRTACVEGIIQRSGVGTPTLFAFERGDLGLVSELRVYA